MNLCYFTMYLFYDMFLAPYIGMYDRIFHKSICSKHIGQNKEKIRLACNKIQRLITYNEIQRLVLIKDRDRRTQGRLSRTHVYTYFYK